MVIQFIDQDTKQSSNSWQTEKVSSFKPIQLDPQSGSYISNLYSPSMTRSKWKQDRQICTQG